MSRIDRVDIIEFLLECGSKISYEALSSAVYLGYLDALKLMVSYGADVNLKETDMDSLILFTAAMSSANITNYLIEAGADVNASSEDGMTALMFAVMYDRIPCAQVLLDAGADPMFINEEGASAESIAKDKGILLC